MRAEPLHATGDNHRPASATLCRDSPGDRGNDWIADRFRLAAGLLSAQGANPFRVAACHEVADTVERLAPDIRSRAEGGFAALEGIPGIRRCAAGIIMELLATGHWGYLERLRGTGDADALFGAVPGIGRALARRIHETSRVDSLDTLAVAARDGRLSEVRGFGERRAAVVRQIVVELLIRISPREADAVDAPDHSLLLEIDREYREKAAAIALPRIVPRRFNPHGEATLPVLHRSNGRWHFTALWSNIARALQPGRTTDWVVIYFHHEDRREGRRTMVTELREPAFGQRVALG